MQSVSVWLVLSLILCVMLAADLYPNLPTTPPRETELQHEHEFFSAYTICSTSDDIFIATHIIVREWWPWPWTSIFCLIVLFSATSSLANPPSGRVDTIYSIYIYTRNHTRTQDHEGRPHPSPMHALICLDLRGRWQKVNTVVKIVARDVSHALRSLTRAQSLTGSRGEEGWMMHSASACSSLKLTTWGLGDQSG